MRAQCRLLAAIKNFAHTADFHPYFKTKILTSCSSLSKLLVQWGTHTARFYCIRQIYMFSIVVKNCKDNTATGIDYRLND